LNQFRRISLLIQLCLSCFLTNPAIAQKTDSLIKQLDSLHKIEAKPENKPSPEIDKSEYTKETNITFKSYFVLLATDLKQEVTGPFHSSRKTWMKVGAFALLEGGLFLAEKEIQRSATSFMERNPNLRNTSIYITDFGGAYEGYVLAAFGAYGLIFKSNKVKTTTLLATQSYLAAGAMSSAVKFLTGRERPGENNPPENNIFNGPQSGGLGSSFPSGHATAAFSAATVFATEYKDQIVIPVIAYSIATLIGISRVTQNAHWATDVFAGAALGYVTGKQVSRNYHRYAKLQAGKKKTATLFFIDYRNGVLLPSVVYKW
jgi:membrane-associated phospholipid phosphatase